MMTRIGLFFPSICFIIKRKKIFETKLFMHWNYSSIPFKRKIFIFFSKLIYLDWCLNNAKQNGNRKFKKNKREQLLISFQKGNIFTFVYVDPSLLNKVDERKRKKEEKRERESTKLRLNCYLIRHMETIPLFVGFLFMLLKNVVFFVSTPISS